MKTIQIFNDFTCWLVWNERILAHWTQVSDRCPLGYLFHDMAHICQGFVYRMWFWGHMNYNIPVAFYKISIVMYFSKGPFYSVSADLRISRHRDNWTVSRADCITIKVIARSHHSLYKIYEQDKTNKMSCLMTKPTKWPALLAKTQISLDIHPVWSESSLSAWRNIGSSATHWAYC